MEITKSNKRMFDVSDKMDIESFSFFLKNSKWKDPCPFVLEFPFLSVPDMVKSKLISAYIDSILSTDN